MTVKVKFMVGEGRVHGLKSRSDARLVTQQVKVELMLRSYILPGEGRVHRFVPGLFP
jgi:hypothetical protein